MSNSDERVRSSAEGAVERRSRSGRLRERLGNTLRIAWWEVTKSTGSVDRRTALMLVVMLLGVGIVGGVVADDGIGLEDDLYTVAIEEDDPYYPVATSTEQFRVVDSSHPEPDLVVRDGTELAYTDETGEAAYDAFRTAVMTYNQQRMLEEDDEAAAFPVLVTLRYTDRGISGFATPGAGDDTAATGGDTPSESDADSTADADASEPEADDEPTEDAGDDDADASEPEADDEPTEDVDDTAIGDTDDGQLPVPALGGGAMEADESTPGTPGSLSAPFPFQSLILAFLLIIPMNVVIQVYGSTIINERLNRRGELLLVSPAGRLEIVAGKTLPYLLGLIAISIGVALLIGGGLLSIAATIPIALAFLTATFVGAMFARSFKELTFVTVTISIVLTAYTFVPAIFSDVTPVALISPLTLVIFDLQGETVQLVEYLFSTVAFYLGSAVLFMLGLGVYREEDMFTQKPIPSKAIDAIVSQLDAIASRSRTGVAAFALPILFIPFVFGAQLLAVALLFSVPEAYALPLIILFAAAIEEVAKSIHLYAGFARSRFESSVRVGVVLGILAGAGFFIGEKLTHVVQFVGLPELAISAAAFGPAFDASPLVVVAMFFAPLVLHVVTTVVATLGASRGRLAYAGGLVVATLLHAAYNLGVISLVG